MVFLYSMKYTSSHKKSENTRCYHCGDLCEGGTRVQEDKSFCCNGCLTVYNLLGGSDLCTYYDLETAPGYKQTEVSKNKYAALDLPEIAERFTLYQDDTQRHVSFYIPHIHCSSCIYLLQHLYKLHKSIEFSTVNFSSKTVSIAYDWNTTQLSEIAGLLASIGYEPRMQDMQSDAPKHKTNHRSLEIGVAGFCFGNIMLFSFPEYLGLDLQASSSWLVVFRWLSFLLSLPVVFFSAREFWQLAWAGIHKKSLNVNVPVALALLIIFSKSCYDIISQTGAGYFDSLAGLVFLMLLGRYIQDKTIGKLNHEIDFKSFFPMAYSVVRDGRSEMVSLENIKPGDQIDLRYNDVVPMDSVLLQENAQIDCSFLTGENMPKYVEANEKLYAGVRNKSNIARIIVSKPFAQSQFVQLWNNPVFQKDKNKEDKWLDRLSLYFTLVVLLMSISAFLYWMTQGSMDRAWAALTTSLIVACPCALLLSATFASGFITQELSKRNIQLKSASILPKLRSIKTIVFDKTGTLTHIDDNLIEYSGDLLTLDQKRWIVGTLRATQHPLAEVLLTILKSPTKEIPKVDSIKEAEQGIEAWIEDRHLVIGTAKYLNKPVGTTTGIEILLIIDNKQVGSFSLRNVYKQGMAQMFEALNNYSLWVLSGDKEANKKQLVEEMGFRGEAVFDQSAEEKLEVVQHLEKEQPVMVIGDGLNDAGALQSATLGVAVVDDYFSFSPSNDIMIPKSHLYKLPLLLQMGKNTRSLVAITFVYSMIYNTIGLSFALSGTLTPVVAAVLMPASSLGIILLSYLGAQYFVRKV